jgi:hypothetical protein
VKIDENFVALSRCVATVDGAVPRGHKVCTVVHANTTPAKIRNVGA